MQQANSSQPESVNLVGDVESGGGEHSFQPNDSSNAESASRLTCRHRISNLLIAAALFALLVGIGIGYGLGQLNKSEQPIAHPNISVENGVPLLKQFLRQHNSPDLLVDPRQPCDDSTYCEKCTAPAISPKQRPEFEEKLCLKSDRITPGCFNCSGSCISTENLKELLGKHIPCDDTNVEVTCCDLMFMQPDKYCGEKGKYICINNTEPPFCNCSANWTGSVCEQMDIQEVQCNCFTLGKAVAYADKIWSCNDAGRPSNWTECSLTGFRETTPMNCICAPSNTTDIRFFPDDERDVKNCYISPS